MAALRSGLLLALHPRASFSAPLLLNGGQVGGMEAWVLIKVLLLTTIHALVMGD